jgi:hypothetical protein
MKAVIALAVLFVGLDGCPRKAPFEEPAAVSPTSPRITRFIARPESIHPGEKIVLIWNARNVNSVLLEQAVEAHDGAEGEYLRRIGEFPAGGTLERSPQWTTVYVISCGDSGIGRVAASATVAVK